MSDSRYPTTSKKRDEPTIKRRSTRACDRCRRTKNKCVKESDDASCNPCIAVGLICTFSAPSAKRGPTKGYLHALEDRCHAAEAIIGILLCIPDQRAVSLLSELAENPYARKVLATVNASPYGYSTRGPIYSGSPPALQKAGLDPLEAGPTTTWQDALITRFTRHAGEEEARPFGSFPSMSLTLCNSSQLGNDPNSTLELDEYAFGELTLSENNQIRFRGKSSGLQLLGQSQRRTSDLGESDIWQLHDTKNGFSPNIEQLDIPMPAIDIQIRLLQIFQDFTYASFPILDLEQLWVDFYAMARGDYVENPHYLKLLLLSIYSISAQQMSSKPTQTEAGPRNSSGELYFGQAKLLLDSSYHLSHPIICQATLLLALREFGCGGLTQAWIYSGMAIRMALDLGLNVCSEGWIRGGAKLFSVRERETRERTWFGCVEMDKWMSLFMGRPLTIRKAMANLLVPTAIDAHLEDAQWPTTLHATLNAFPLSPGRISSCWNAKCGLSVITCDILYNLYPVRKESRTGAILKSEAAKMVQRLQEWSDNLPDSLRIDTQEQINKAPAHLLCLHMARECAAVAVQFSLIDLKRISSSPQDKSPAQAMAAVIQSATRIHVLVSAYFMNFGVANATPLCSFKIFSAGTTWVAALALEPQNGIYAQSLSQCLAWLDELKPFWPSAKQHYDLLCKALRSSPPTYNSSVGVSTVGGYYHTVSMAHQRRVGIAEPSNVPYYSPFDWVLHEGQAYTAGNEFIAD